MHASLLGFCLESLFIDNDMLGAVNRNVRGIEVNDETLSAEVIADVCLNGPGHYLGSGQTLDLMQKEYIYPQVGNRMSPKEWNEAGKPDLIEVAARRKHKVLSGYFPDYLPDDVDKAIRANHKIMLDRSLMQPGHKRFA
jgi:trimethylamine--corrinoid protein Co-methyltransferase